MMLPAERMRGDEIVDATLAFLQSQVEARAVAFTWIHESGHYEVAGKRGITREFTDEYSSTACKHDPLNADYLLSFPDKTHYLSDWVNHEGNEGRADEHRFFLRSHGFADEVDILIRRPEYPLGVLTAWTDKVEWGRVPDLNVLRNFVSLVLAEHPYARCRNRYFHMHKRWNMTQREIEICELIRFGLSNEEIAEVCDIGLSTVKTHIVHCFDKAGTRSRSSLLAMLNLL